MRCDDDDSFCSTQIELNFGLDQKIPSRNLASQVGLAGNLSRVVGNNALFRDFNHLESSKDLIKRLAELVESRSHCSLREYK